MPMDARKMMEDIIGGSFDLMVPAMIGEKVKAILVLGEKRDKSHYSHDDINVFNIISRHAALSIEHCEFLSEFKKNQERLFQTEKLAALGGMADGVAHQIKNRLNHFSVAAGEMKLEVEDFFTRHPNFITDYPDVPATYDYLTQISNSIVKNVKRTNDVVQGILNYARVEEKSNFFSEFSFTEIYKLASELLMIKHQLASVPVSG